MSYYGSYHGRDVSDPTGMAHVLPGLIPAVAAPTLDRRISRFARRIAGGGLTLLCTAVALSLLTWASTDPSLTHSASGSVRNWMGPVGAIIADLLVQLLGLASIVAVLPAGYWSLQLTNHGSVPRIKTKLACAPLAVLCLAIAMSSLPQFLSWPLQHGYGGMVGDLVYGRLTGLLAVVNATRAGAATGLFGLASGLLLFQRALGLTNNDLKTIFAGAQPAAAEAGWKSWLRSKSARNAATMAAPELPVVERHGGGGVNGPALAESGRGLGYPNAPMQGYAQAPTAQPLWQGAGYVPVPQPAPNAQWQHAAPQYRPQAGYGVQQPVMAAQPPPRQVGFTHARQTWAQAPLHPVAPQTNATVMPQLPADPMSLERAPATDRADDPAFDLTTDKQSRLMAERFAPTSTATSTASDSIDDLIDDRHAGWAAHEPEIVMPKKDLGTLSIDPRQATIAPGGFYERLAGVRRHEPLTQLYKRPSLNLLKRTAVAARKGEIDASKLRERSRLLLETLADFGVKGEITAVRPGPVVTLFEFEPARGTKSSRVIGLADDIARSMSARAVRIAVVPGINAIGIELPNASREPVSLRELLETDHYRKSEAKLPLALGKGIGGEPVIADLSRMPHLLVAGTTGAGKSVGVNAMILSLLYQLSPDDCRMIMIDPKMLELSVYNGIPHLLTPVVTDPNKAVAALNWAVSEMEARYKRMSVLSVRNIEVYNNRVRNALKRDELHGGQGTTLPSVAEDLAPMPHIVIVVDEFADLMAVAGKEIEFAVLRLAQMARAAGIHLIMATQRPSVDIITGTIKANFPTRISFRVTSRIDSRTILNEQGAEQLLGHGDMLYAGGGGQIVRVHGPFVSDEEVEAIATYLRTLGAPKYVDGITDTPELETPKAAEALDEDDLYDRAVALVRADQKASTSYLQRRLGIGYNRAADLIERMEGDGLIGPAVGGKRELLSLKSTTATAVTN